VEAAGRNESKDPLQLREEFHPSTSFRFSGDPLTAASLRNASGQDDRESGILSGNRRRQRSELRPHPKEEAMSHALATVLRDGRRPSASASGNGPRTVERPSTIDHVGVSP